MADLPSPDVLLGADTVDHYRRAVAQGAERVAARLAQVDAPVHRRRRPTQLEPTIDGIDLDTPLADTAAALDELEEIYLRDAVYFHHPRYLAHLNCPVVIPAAARRGACSRAVNSSLDTWDQSAGGTLIERRLIDWTAAPHRPRPGRRRRVHQRRHAVQPPGAAARPRRGVRPAAPTRRTARSSPPRSATSASRSRRRCSASARTPSSPSRATATSGCARRRSPRELERCRADGHVPMAVVATAGTTDFGCIDPLPEIADAVRASTAPGCTSTPPTAAGCSSRARAATCSTASSAPTRSPSTTTSPSSSRSARAPCWSATARRCGTSPTTPTTSTRAHGRASDPQPGRQVPADHPPLRRAQAVDDAAHAWAPTASASCSTRSCDLAAEALRAARPPTRASRSSSEPQLSTLVFRYIPRPSPSPPTTANLLRPRGAVRLRRGRRRRHQGRRPPLPEVHPAQPRDDARRHRRRPRPDRRARRRSTCARGRARIA